MVICVGQYKKRRMGRQDEQLGMFAVKRGTACSTCRIWHANATQAEQGLHELISMQLGQRASASLANYYS